MYKLFYFVLKDREDTWLPPERVRCPMTGQATLPFRGDINHPGFTGQIGPPPDSLLIVTSLRETNRGYILHTDSTSSDSSVIDIPFCSSPSFNTKYFHYNFYAKFVIGLGCFVFARHYSRNVVLADFVLFSFWYWNVLLPRVCIKHQVFDYRRNGRVTPFGNLRIKGC